MYMCCLCVACVLPVWCLCVACVLPVCCLCVARVLHVRASAWQRGRRSPSVGSLASLNRHNASGSLDGDMGVELDGDDALYVGMTPSVSAGWALSPLCRTAPRWVYVCDQIGRCDVRFPLCRVFPRFLPGTPTKMT